MKTFALYRYPHEDMYHGIEQTDGQPILLPSVAAIGGHSGFVVAPFAPSPEQPVVVIRPDITYVRPVSAAADAGFGRVSVPDAAAERERYGVDFRNFHAQLADETFGKIVLARCSHAVAESEGDAEKLFLRACNMYPRMFVALVSAPQCGVWLMATPEILLRGQGSQWATVALAGTMRLTGEQLDFDTPGAHTMPDDICWSTKNRYEQRYVADYIEQCIEQFSADFEANGPYTTRAGDLVHLRTDFGFSLDADADIGAVANLLHPTPAVCGLPKYGAFDFIMANESVPRGYYSGFAGPLNIAGATSLYVSLRCMRIEGCHLYMYAGGGLLADSVEEDEWNETEAKLATMRRLLDGE